MAKIREREKAIALRKNGESIGVIAQQLSVSKSTVSNWCRDIVLTDSAIKKIARHGKERSVIGLLRYSESIRKKRIDETHKSMRKGSQKLGKLTERDIYCIGLGIYWGEGYKHGSQEFGFTNSDPDMVLFYIKWLKVVFGIELEDLILRVSINACHQSRLAAVESYWSELTKVPIQQFTKTSLINAASKKVYTNTERHMGTLRIKVRKGTKYRREVLGALDALAKQN